MKMRCQWHPILHSWQKYAMCQCTVSLLSVYSSTHPSIILSINHETDGFSEVHVRTEGYPLPQWYHYTPPPRLQYPMFTWTTLYLHVKVQFHKLWFTHLDHPTPKMVNQSFFHTCIKTNMNGHIQWLNMCVRVSQQREAPKRRPSAFGLWGLSRRIIDDVFIARCGVMWGLGHSMCVSLCMRGGVDSAAPSLTPTTPAIGTDKSLLPNASYKNIYMHTAATEIHWSNRTYTNNCTQTHSPEPIPLPEIKSLPLDKILTIRQLVFHRHSVSPSCHARPCRSLFVCLFFCRSVA